MINMQGMKSENFVDVEDGVNRVQRVNLGAKEGGGLL
jgi:hypothetical protein